MPWTLFSLLYVCSSIADAPPWPMPRTICLLFLCPGQFTSLSYGLGTLILLIYGLGTSLSHPFALCSWHPTRKALILFFHTPIVMILGHFCIKWDSFNNLCPFTSASTSTHKSSITYCYGNANTWSEPQLLAMYYGGGESQTICHACHPPAMRNLVEQMGDNCG